MESYTIADKGLEEMWKAVQKLRGTKLKLRQAPRSVFLLREYQVAERELVHAVLEAFGEVWEL